MNIVFDVAGVLLRWQPHEILRERLVSQSLDEASARDWVPRFFEHWGGDWGDFDRGSVDPDELGRRIARRTRLPLREVQAVIDGIPEVLTPMPATVDLLHRLKAAGRRLRFLSNMPAPYAERLLRTRADVFGHFDDGVFSGHVGMVKPERQIFDLASQRFGIEPADSLFIDDAPANVSAAREAGWGALLFEDGARCGEALRGMGLV